MVAEVSVGPNPRVCPAAMALTATPPAVTATADAQAAAMRRVRLSLRFILEHPFLRGPGTPVTSPSGGGHVAGLRFGGQLSRRSCTNLHLAIGGDRRCASSPSSPHLARGTSPSAPTFMACFS